MKNAIQWFEIPVNDLERAKQFYSQLLAIEMQDFKMEQLQMVLFPVEEGTVGGALCYHSEFYKPSHEGPLVYLNANPDMSPALERLEGLGGQLIQPKTLIREDLGYMALIQDTEGNRVALMSQS